MAWGKQTWVDDDGSLTVGTPFSAAKMNNIENGIEERSTGNGFKEPCRVATTGNVTISTALNNGDSIDGVTLVTGDRVLVKEQTSKKENGPWIVGATPTRATDADAAGELRGGTMLYIEEGTKYGGTFCRITTKGSITPGTTEHDWKLAFPKIKGGKTKITAASGNGWYANITHGLGTTPTRVQINDAQGTFQRTCTADEYGATTFRAGVWRGDGANTTEATVAWEAVYEE